MAQGTRARRGAESQSRAGTTISQKDKEEKVSPQWPEGDLKGLLYLRQSLFGSSVAHFAGRDRERGGEEEGMMVVRGPRMNQALEVFCTRTLTPSDPSVAGDGGSDAAGKIKADLLRKWGMECLSLTTSKSVVPPHSSLSDSHRLTPAFPSDSLLSIKSQSVFEADLALWMRNFPLCFGPRTPSFVPPCPLQRREIDDLSDAHSSPSTCTSGSLSAKRFGDMAAQISIARSLTDPNESSSDRDAGALSPALALRHVLPYPTTHCVNAIVLAYNSHLRKKRAMCGSNDSDNTECGDEDGDDAAGSSSCPSSESVGHLPTAEYLEEEKERKADDTCLLLSQTAFLILQGFHNFFSFFGQRGCSCGCCDRLPRRQEDAEKKVEGAGGDEQQHPKDRKASPLQYCEHHPLARYLSYSPSLLGWLYNWEAKPHGPNSLRPASSLLSSLLGPDALALFLSYVLYPPSPSAVVCDQHIMGCFSSHSWAASFSSSPSPSPYPSTNALVIGEDGTGCGSKREEGGAYEYDDNNDDDGHHYLEEEIKRLSTCLNTFRMASPRPGGSTDNDDRDARLGEGEVEVDDNESDCVQLPAAMFLRTYCEGLALFISSVGSQTNRVGDDACRLPQDEGDHHGVNASHGLASKAPMSFWPPVLPMDLCVAIDQTALHEKRTQWFTNVLIPYMLQIREVALVEASAIAEQSNSDAQLRARVEEEGAERAARAEANRIAVERARCADIYADDVSINKFMSSMTTPTYCDDRYVIGGRSGGFCYQISAKGSVRQGTIMAPAHGSTPSGRLQLGLTTKGGRALSSSQINSVTQKGAMDLSPKKNGGGGVAKPNTGRGAATAKRSSVASTKKGKKKKAPPAKKSAVKPQAKATKAKKAPPSVKRRRGRFDSSSSSESDSDGDTSLSSSSSEEEEEDGEGNATGTMPPKSESSSQNSLIVSIVDRIACRKKEAAKRAKKAKKAQQERKRHLIK